MSRYFAPQEFLRCDPPCEIEQMNANFLDQLDRVRLNAGVPMMLTSAFRSREWDLAKGRSGNSAHTRGLAVDVWCKDSSTRYRIIRAAILCDIRRIGIGENFIHLDCDYSLPQGVIWHYYEQ